MSKNLYGGVRGYRLYKVLKLNLLIKHRKRLIRDKPERHICPEEINQIEFKDFIRDE